MGSSVVCGENHLEIGRSLELDMEMREQRTVSGLSIALGMRSPIPTSFWIYSERLLSNLLGKENEKGDIC